MNLVASRATFFAVVTAVSALVLIYPIYRLGVLLDPNDGWVGPAMLSFILPFAIRILHERVNTAATRVLSALGLTWLGACFVLLSLLLPTELILLTGLVPDHSAGLAIGVIWILICAYSVVNAHKLHIKHIDITGQTKLADQTMIQISDVHIGSRQPRLLDRIVKRINTLKPNYTVITGDLIDMRDISVDELAPLGEIDSPTYFCIGNHERYVDVDAICQRLQQLGIVVLRNQSVETNHIQFIGIDDAESKTQVGREISKIEPAADRYRILLYHRPDDAESAARWGAHLMLTGHTHRGQIFPFNFLVKKVFPRLYREYDVEGMLLYVSPGTGTWGPVMRLGSKCEITQFRFSA